MTDSSWRVEASDAQALAAPSGGFGLVSLHFVHSALRRQWRVWVGLGCLGLMLGASWTMLVPTKDIGTVSLMLAHDPASDPAQSMATDVSLLRTATVATDVIRELGLDESPYEFQGSVVAEVVSTSVLTLEVSGPDDGAAVSRARALSDSFLEFRAAQLRSQADALTRGYRDRIAALEEQSDELSQQFETLRNANAGDGAQASVLLNKLSQVAAEIETAQQTIEDASLKVDSIIAASYVLDPPAPTPDPSGLKRLLLTMASGAIGGTAAGVMLVLFQALTSDRLRLREEVALALDVPVRVSVGRVRPSRSPWRFRSNRASSQRLQLLVHALHQEIPRAQYMKPANSSREGRKPDATRRPPTKMAVAAVDDVDSAKLVMACLAARLSAEGLSVFMVDLTEAGGLEAALERALDQQKAPPSRKPVLHRPDGLPALASGPIGRSAARRNDLSMADPHRNAWENADVALTLTEVDPAVGAENVRSWADQVVLLVTAGRSSAERLSTVAELVRSARLQLLFAMLIGSDSTDASLGEPRATGRSATPRASRAST